MGPRAAPWVPRTGRSAGQNTGHSRRQAWGHTWGVGSGTLMAAGLAPRPTLLCPLLPLPVPSSPTPAADSSGRVRPPAALGRGWPAAPRHSGVRHPWGDAELPGVPAAGPACLTSAPRPPDGSGPLPGPRCAPALTSAAGPRWSAAGPATGGEREPLGGRWAQTLPRGWAGLGLVWRSSGPSTR